MANRISNLFKRRSAARTSPVALFLQGGEICCPGYTALDKNPEIVAGCRKIASLLASTTIHLMSNTDAGDIRIRNELSRLVDIDPMPNMTRSTWIEGIIMTLLLYGRGNAVVWPHTYQGYIKSLEPIAAERVSILCDSYRDYRISIDGKAKDPANLLHFVFNPDPSYLYKGQGLTVTLKSLAQDLGQAEATKKAFLSSEYKPSLIVKVDSMTEEFAGPEGRAKLIKDYIQPEAPGQPWLIPAEQFEVEQVKPLSLSDLAISDTVQLDKKTVASLLGVPAFVVGAGDYKKDEWNEFVQTTVMALAKSIASELTKKLIISPNWYWAFNVWSLMDYDLATVSSVLLSGADRGFVNGDEWRDRVHLDPAGLKEFNVLENYIPIDMTGDQKKLAGN